MNNLNEQPINDWQTTPMDPAGETVRDDQTQKKPFIEPTISVPQDVLETTKFFYQAVEAGSL